MLRKSLRRLRHFNTVLPGQAMPEYAVIAGAILVAAYLVFQTVGTDVNAAMLTVLPAL